MAYTGAQVGSAVSGSAGRIAEMLMGIGQQKRQRAQMADERRRQEERQGYTDRLNYAQVLANLQSGGFGAEPVEGRTPVVLPNPRGGEDRLYRQPEPEKPTPYRYVTTGDGYAAIPEGGTQAVPVTLPGGGRLAGPRQRTPELSPGQQLEVKQQEALGDALTWARAALDPDRGKPGRANIDRETGLRLLRTQHGLSAGQASRIWQQAEDNIKASRGRALVNEGRANRNAQGSGNEFQDALISAMGGGQAPAPAPRGRPPIVGTGSAYAGEPSDTGQQYIPQAGAGNEQQRMWDEAAAVLRSQGKNPTSILGPRP